MITHFLKKWAFHRAIFRTLALALIVIGIISIRYWHNSSVQTCLVVRLSSEIVQIIPQPNIYGLLIVSLDNNKNLNLNTQKIGNISELLLLTVKLKGIFEQRERDGIVDGSLLGYQDLTTDERTLKQVIILAPHSAKYDDVIRTIDAVRNAGTKDIVLQLSETPK